MIPVLPEPSEHPEPKADSSLASICHQKNCGARRTASRLVSRFLREADQDGPICSMMKSTNVLTLRYGLFLRDIAFASLKLTGWPAEENASSKSMINETKPIESKGLTSPKTGASGPISSRCSGSRLWFKTSIQPRTIDSMSLLFKTTSLTRSAAFFKNRRRAATYSTHILSLTSVPL